MIAREPTIERLATARQLLLEPFGLDETHLARALAEIRAHRLDDADLYFQYTRSEGWSLEEGIVKTGSFSIDQGVGVRAVSGEKTAFAYSDDISEASLLDAARTVRSISALGQKGQAQAATQKIAKSRTLYPGLDPIATLKIEELMQELKKNYTIVIVTHNMQQAARASDYTAMMMLSQEGARSGTVIEFDDTTRIFTNPKDKRTEDYVTGRFG